MRVLRVIDSTLYDKLMCILQQQESVQTADKECQTEPSEDIVKEPNSTAQQLPEADTITVVEKVTPEEVTRKAEGTQWTTVDLDSPTEDVVKPIPTKKKKSLSSKLVKVKKAQRAKWRRGSKRH